MFAAFLLLLNIDYFYLYILYLSQSRERSCMQVGRRKGIMSYRLKEELAKELGFYDVVQKEGWGSIRSKDAGNMVKRAIEIAQKNLVDSSNQL